MIPAKLEKGDYIGIISPSSILREKEDLETLFKSYSLMKQMGYKIVLGNYAFSDETGYGTTAKNKAKDINDMFENEHIKAIFAITGGENSLSTFDYLNWKIIRSHPKIFCGFSDTTSLLNEITEKTGLVTFLGPSFKSIASGSTDYRFRAVIDRFQNMKTNLAYEKDLAEFKVIRPGTATGKFIGGNLSLTTDLIDGKYKINFENKILLIEEFAYESSPEKVSHDLYLLKQNGIFDMISGIWIGNYDGNIPLEKILLDTIDDIKFDKPIIKSENFGHGEKKIVIPIGAKGSINTLDYAPFVKIEEPVIRA